MARRLRRGARGIHREVIPSLFMGIGLGRLFVSAPSSMGGSGSQSVITIVEDKSQSMGQKLENGLFALGENLYSPGVYGPIIAGVGAAALAGLLKLKGKTKIDRKWSIL